MGIPARLHATSAVALAPAFAFAPVAGVALLTAWLILARPRRPSISRDAILVLAAAVTLIAMWHVPSTASWPAIAGMLLAGLMLGLALIRLDSVVHRAAAIAAGVGAAGTAGVIAVQGLLEVNSGAIGQFASANLHASGTAALALVLLAGSALAWRGRWAARALGTVGVGAGLVLIVLTGSRAGLAGLLIMLAVSLLLLAGRCIALTGRGQASVTVVCVATLLLLGGLQAVLMTPNRLDPWWSPMWGKVMDAMEAPAGERLGQLVLVDRMHQLVDPLKASGGRLAAWKLALEIIAPRPLLGHGFDAIGRLYAPAAASELSSALSHPHHGFLILLLQGGTLLTVAVLAFLGSLGLRLIRAALQGDGAAFVGVAVLAGLVMMELVHSVLQSLSVAALSMVVMIMATAGTEETAGATSA